jgi:putative ABC transport system permease protein
VGFFKQRDPQDAIWWEDPRPFELVTDPGINEDEYTVSLLLSRGDMDTLQTDQVDWRFVIDQTQITPDTAAAISQQLVAIKSRVDASGAKLSSSLPLLLQQYLEDLGRVRTVIYLLVIQSFAFVLYSLAVLSAHANRLSESEIVTLAGRGASQGLISAAFSLDRLLLALVAAGLTGPLLARVFLEIWSRLSGESTSVSLTRESLLLAALGAALGWLALILPVISSARRSLLEFQRQRARPDTQTAWQKRYLDVFLLVLGGLAYWQLSSSGGFYFRQVQQNNRADPLLLIGPTLLLIALALIFLRFFPYLLRFFAWAAGITRGLVLKLGLSRLARDPVQASQMLLLITMAVGLTVFSAGFRDSLNHAQQQAARYQAGADLRVLQGRNSVEEIGSLPGVRSAAVVFRDQVERDDRNRLTMLAVDATRLDQVAQYPDGMSNISMTQIMRALRPPDRVGADGRLMGPEASSTDSDFSSNPYIQATVNQVPVPAVFSFAALPANTGIGDIVRISYHGQNVLLEVRGILADFPTVSTRYLLVDHSLLGEFFDLESPGDVRSREIWLAVNPESATALSDHFRAQNQLLASAAERLEVLTASAIALGTQRAFTLNAIVLVLLSISGFLLISYFNARERAYEIGVLRAGGLSGSQLVGMLAGEGVIVLVLGFVSGTGVGLGLLMSMRFYLSQVLRQVLPELEVRALTLDAQTLVGVYGLLALFFAAATAVLLVVLLRTGIQRTLRLGEE